MNAQRLKNAILQEAIEGRLVPQDPNDEPASVLLARIRKEKERLVKEGKLKKKDLEVKPISEEEIPFEIPDSWEWCRLRDVLSVKSGDFLNVRSLNEELNYPVYGGNGITGTYDKYNVESDTLIIGRVGFYCGSIHKTFSKAWVTDNALIVSFTKDNLYVNYLQYVLGWLNIRTTSNSTAQPVVSGKGIYPLLFPLPPLAEQHRIVAKIEELLPKIEEYGKVQDELNKLNSELPERLKKSILQEAIEGHIVPQDPNDEPASVLLAKIRKEKEQLVKAGKLKKKDIVEVPIVEDDYPYSIPESWCWVRLEDITTYISRGKSPIYSDLKKYPIVAQKCNQWSGFSLEKAKFADPTTIEKYAEERILRDGDLLWNSTGLGTLGRMAIYNSEVNPYRWAAADSHVTVIRTRPDFCVYKYLYYYFASNEVQSVIEDKSDGSTKQKELYLDTVKKYEVPLPPLAEQHRIVEKLEQLLGEIDKLKV